MPEAGVATGRTGWKLDIHDAHLQVAMSRYPNPPGHLVLGRLGGAAFTPATRQKTQAMAKPKTA